MIRRQRGRQNLDGDLTFQLGVGGPIHLPHAAFTNLGGDFVDAEARAGGEGQNWRDYNGSGRIETSAFEATNSRTEISRPLGDFSLVTVRNCARRRDELQGLAANHALRFRSRGT